MERAHTVELPNGERVSISGETHTTTSFGVEHTIRGGDESLLRRIVQQFNTGTAQSAGGESPLHMVAASGKVKNCEMFLQSPMQFDINGPNDRGETPLFAAIYARNWETTRFLIERGADVTWKSKAGSTPLHIAANKGTKELIELLISKGADLHASSYFGTPLYIAAASDNIETMNYLLQLKADPNPPTNSSPESTLDSSPFFVATIGKSIECLEQLVKAGADPNRASYLSTPLRLAATLCDEGLIRFLLKVGADPNMLDPVGHKPIEYGAWDGCREAVEVLFPVTSPIACYPDWSVNGIMLHANSKEGKALYYSKQKKIYFLAKAKGEDALKRKNYYDAMNWFNQAKVVATDPEVVSNISLCYAMMYDGSDALKYAKECIALRPRWAKAHYREGAAWKLLKEFKKAAKAFSQAKALEPHNKEINKELRAVRAEQMKRNLDKN